jgi:hypothetical protein
MKIILRQTALGTYVWMAGGNYPCKTLSTMFAVGKSLGINAVEIQYALHTMEEKLDNVAEFGYVNKSFTVSSTEVGAYVNH